jgi:Condensation domain
VDLWLRIVAPAGDPDRWLRDWAGSEAQATFDVREAPLVRLSLAPLGPERHALLLVVDHLIGDGWTMRLLLEELARLYEAERGLATEPLPPPVHFAEYAERQRRDLAEAASADLLEHWRRRLPRSAADLCLRLPDFQAPPEPGGGRAVVLGERQRLEREPVLPLRFGPVLGRAGAPARPLQRREAERVHHQGEERARHRLVGEACRWWCAWVRALDRTSVIREIARVLDADVAEITGQPRAPDAIWVHAAVPAIRRALIGHRPGSLDVTSSRAARAAADIRSLLATKLSRA